MNVLPTYDHTHSWKNNQMFKSKFLNHLMYKEDNNQVHSGNDLSLLKSMIILFNLVNDHLDIKEKCSIIEMRLNLPGSKPLQQH